MNEMMNLGSKINALAGAGKAFFFLIDFEKEKGEVFPAEHLPEDVLISMPGISEEQKVNAEAPEFTFEAQPPSFSDYQTAFSKVKHHMLEGNTFLVNLTFESRLETSLSLGEIFRYSQAKYKLLYKNQFVVFSPETFVQIQDGKISCCPMKGTIDASIDNAAEKILQDPKESAEHNTIVDLIRNDLAMVSENVRVEKFRYLENIKTHKGSILQMSSRITGDLPENYREQLGDILLRILPAGSISGAPKSKTLEIIHEAENYHRGFYTGIFGHFDGQNLDSAVMIRFIENKAGKLFFKSGGGITAMSKPAKEYDELIQKIYVPVY